MSGSLMPTSGGSLMPSSTVPTQSTPSGGFVDDLFFTTDNQNYIGYDGDNSTNGRPREIRFTRRLASEYAAAVGTTPAETIGIVLRNSTAAAAGAQQYSQSLFFVGQGWKTDATAATREVIFRVEAQPVQGTANPSVNFALNASINGATYTSPFLFNSTGSATWTAPALGTGTATGFVYQNSTAAAVGAQQNSPIFQQLGYGWKTDATAASQSVAFQQQVRPVQSTAAPTGALHWSSSINGAAITDLLALSDTGVLTLGAISGGIALSAAKAFGATPTEALGWVLRNSTAAGAGAQQWSPAIYLAGQGWKTDATAGSQEAIWRIVNTPVQGAAAPTTNIIFASSIGGAGYSTKMTLTSAGTLSVTGSLSASGGSVVAGNVRISTTATAGVTGDLTLCDTIDTVGDTPAILGNWTVNGSTGTFHGWLRMFDGLTQINIPCWRAS